MAKANLDRLTRSIVRAFHPQKMILFGSRASGPPPPGSDVDLLVIMESEKPAGRRAADLYRLLKARRFFLDMLVFTPAEICKKLAGFGPFLEDLPKKGCVLYDAG